jgi:hypothetical protein
VKAKMKAENKIFSKTMWVVGSDLEYLTFILNLSRENSDDLWKENMKVARVVDIDSELVTIQQLLCGALSTVLTNLEETYRKVWLAQLYVLRIQRKEERLTTLNSHNRSL